jgi:group I intron endonuclease
MKASGIYKIQSTAKSDKIYIGSAIDLNKRWNNHISDLRNNKHSNKKLQNHVNKYGLNDLVFTVIEPCLPIFLTTREQEYIDKLSPVFNLRPYAASNLGIKFSEEHNRKAGLASIGRIPWNKGIKMSDEYKQKCIDRQTGVRYSEDTRLKHCVPRKGIPKKGWTQPKEVNEIRSKALKGIPKSDVVRQKMKDAWVLRRLNKVA